MKRVDFNMFRRYWYIVLSCSILFLQVINIVLGEKFDTHFDIPFVDPASYVLIFAILYQMVMKLKTIAFQFDLLPATKAMKIGVNIIGYLLLLIPIDIASNYWQATDTIYLSGNMKIKLIEDYASTNHVYSLYSCRSFICKQIDTKLSNADDNSYTNKNIKLVRLNDSSNLAIIRSGVITDIVDIRQGMRIDMPFVNLASDTTNCKIFTKLK